MISIHAPIQSAMEVKSSHGIMQLYFNPRTHTECDFEEAQSYLTIEISIHAPIQSAMKAPGWSRRLAEFQSTHPYRVRLRIFSYCTPVYIFQSTHPYRVRCNNRSCCQIRSSYFNPRTHTECDLILTDYGSYTSISIHAPIQSAIVLTNEIRYVYRISIHAPIQSAIGFSHAPSIC